MIRDRTMTELQRAASDIGWLLVCAGGVLIVTGIAIGLMVAVDVELSTFLHAPIQQAGH